MISRKELLVNFFKDEASEVRALLTKVKEIDLDSKLTNDMRTILELINHIAQIPRIDVDIYSGKLDSGDKTHKLELKLDRKSVDEVLEIFDENCEYLISYFEKISDNDLVDKKLRPFYEPDSELRSWAHFLPKLTSHLALHKGILWAYMKVSKLDVNMFNYYGVK